MCKVIKDHSVKVKFTSLILMTLILSFSPILQCTSIVSKKHDAIMDKDVYLYVGSYAEAEEYGLHVFVYDEKNLQIKEIQQLSGHRNPSFLAIHPSGDFLYSVNEIADFNGVSEGSVTSFAIDRDSGELEYINQQSSKGAHPCHISVPDNGNHILVANYSGGNLAVLPVAPDGSLEMASDIVQHEGSGINERRQRGPHAHSIYPNLDGSMIFSADLGTNKVMIYEAVNDEGALIPNSIQPYLKMEPGAGPRHIAFHPSGKWIYVINELNSTITRLEFDPQTGNAHVLESVTTLPEGWDDESFCADIHVHPSGRFLYASNRGHNSIAVFKIENDGRVVPKGHESVRGEWPRNFAIDPAGARIFVANQHSNNITIFDIDQNSGGLSFTGIELKIQKPVCIKFLDF